MSKCYKEIVRCPSCDAEQEFLIWQSINVTLDPKLKEQLLKGELTTLVCENCGAKTAVGYDCLYHDMDKSLAIWFEMEENPEAKKARSDFSGLAETTRLVRTIYELFDKIKVFEDGLDDLDIELLKLYVGMSQDLDADVPFYYDHLRESESGEKFLVFAVVIDGVFKTIQYPFAHFETTILPIAEEFRAQLDRSTLAWAKVDRHFILETMGKPD